MELLQCIYDYVNDKGWAVLDDPEEQIVLMVSSTHNTNVRVTASELYGDTKYLLRINHVSPLGLDDQIEYEFCVLQAMRRSGVTPRPFYCDVAPREGLGCGTLFMEYLEGQPLNYDEDWGVAAEVLSKIHSVPVDNRLLVQNNPLSFLGKECLRHIHGEDPAVVSYYAAEYRNIVACVEKFSGKDNFVIINGSMRANDFLIDGEDEGDKVGKLVDWEAGIVSSRYIDIGLFFVHACSEETGLCWGEKEKRQFLEVYLEAAGLDIPIEEAMQRADLYEQAIRLYAKGLGHVGLESSQVRGWV